MILLCQVTGFQPVSNRTRLDSSAKRVNPVSLNYFGMPEELSPQSQPSQLSQDQPRQHSSKRKSLIIPLAVLVLAVAGYILFIKKEPSPTFDEQIEKFFTIEKIVRTDIPEEKLKDYRDRMASARANHTSPDEDIDFNAYMSAASVKKGVGDYEGARDIWEYVNSVRPKNSISFGNLGDLYANFLKNLPKSESNYLRAIENDPTDPGYARGLLELYEYQMQSKLGFSEDLFKGAAEKNPDKADFSLLLAHYYELSKDYEKAIATWEKLAKIDSSQRQLVDREIRRVKAMME